MFLSTKKKFFVPKDEYNENISFTKKKLKIRKLKKDIKKKNINILC